MKNAQDCPATVTLDGWKHKLRTEAPTKQISHDGEMKANKASYLPFASSHTVIIPVFLKTESL